ncbi:MAG: PorP/SprF family type IX secretion system membrane protein [Bacteroidota bacterium]
MTNNNNLLLGFLFLASVASGQDLHLSHIHASPVALNPSTVGLFEGKVRVVANIRSQWNTITKGYKTMIASTDMKVVRLKKNDHLSAAFTISADQAGDLNLTNAAFGGAISYLKGFDYGGKNWLAFGGQISHVGSHYDHSEIRSIEAIRDYRASFNTRRTYWDLSVGMSWYYRPNRFELFYLGLAVHHLNQPQVSFQIGNPSPNGVLLYRRLVLHSGASFRLSRQLTLKPSVLFMDQGPHREWTMGSFFRYKTHRGGFKKSTLSFVYLGLWLRTFLQPHLGGLDAIVASLRYDYHRMKITFSYDINISALRAVSHGRGALEVSFICTFDWKKPKSYKVKCPVL